MPKVRLEFLGRACFCDLPSWYTEKYLPVIRDLMRKAMAKHEDFDWPEWVTVGYCDHRFESAEKVMGEMYLSIISDEDYAVLEKNGMADDEDPAFVEYTWMAMSDSLHEVVLDPSDLGPDVEVETADSKVSKLEAELRVAQEEIASLKKENFSLSFRVFRYEVILEKLTGEDPKELSIWD